MKELDHEKLQAYRDGQFQFRNGDTFNPYADRPELNKSFMTGWNDAMLINPKRDILGLTPEQRKRWDAIRA